MSANDQSRHDQRSRPEQRPVASPHLDGQVAVVTGGRGDIGAAIVAGLAAAGAKVAVADLTPVPETAPPGIDHARLDVADPRAVHAWLDNVEQRLGVPTLVVPAAATSTVRDSLTLSPAEWAHEIEVDLNAPFYLTQEAARRMIAAGRPGRVVMIGSWAGHAPHQHVPAYSVAKAGLRMLTQVLAIQLAPHRILVNELAIGVVDAGVSRAVFATHSELKSRSEHLAPVGHLVGIAEITAEVLTLCDPGRRSMTGATVLLDGGMSLRTAFTGVDDD